MGSENDELVPKRGRGRPIRSVSLADRLEKRPARKNGIRCGQCPKHSRNVCSILAQYRPADTEACKYGKVLISMQKRSGGRK